MTPFVGAVFSPVMWDVVPGRGTISGLPAIEPADRPFVPGKHYEADMARSQQLEICDAHIF